MLRKGRSRAEFAEYLGVHENTLGGYERGERLPDWAFLTRLREKLDTDLNWLATGRRSESGALATAGSLSADFIAIPRLDVRASAGGGRLAVIEEEETQVVAFRRDWLRRLGVSPKHAQIIVAEGDSMEPTIGHGDLVLVDRSIETIVDEGIYVLVYAGLVKLKRIQVLISGVVLLKSDNPAYHTEEVKSHEQPELIIEGRVRWAGGAI